MNTVVELAPIVKTVTVRQPSAEAFRLFAEEISAWWPLRTHTRAKDAAGEVTVRATFESRVGGRVYETLNTGEQRDWGQVLAFEPPSLLRFSFQMGRPRDESGEVEVRFEPLDDATTRVTLVHSHWERWGDDALRMAGRYDSGWQSSFVAGYGALAGAI